MCGFFLGGGGRQKGPVARRHVETGLIDMQAVVRSLGEWLERDEDKERAGKSCPSVRSLATVTANAKQTPSFLRPFIFECPRKWTPHSRCHRPASESTLIERRDLF